jgi:hypothetical protein
MDKGRVVPLRSYGTERVRVEKQAQNDEFFAVLWLAELIDENRRYRRAVRRHKRRRFAN